MNDAAYKHYNYPADIVSAWDTGEPLAALCGYKRVLIEGKVPDGDICMNCAEVAAEIQVNFHQNIKLPQKVNTPEEVRAMAKGHGNVWRMYIDPKPQKWSK